MARRQKVVSLRGGTIPLPVVDRTVIDAIAALMEEAKAGQVTGFAYATVGPHGHVTTSYGGNVDGISMVAATAILAHRIVSSI